MEYVISEYVYIYIAWDMLEHHRRGTCLKDTGILVDMHMPHTHIYIYTQLFISKKKNIVGIKMVVELIGISWDTRSVLGIWLE